MRSKRKPHNQDAGYICERKFNGSHVVIYLAEAQGLDVDGRKYAVVCTQHGTIVGETSLPAARKTMKYPQFCEECMKADDWELRHNPRLLTALQIARIESEAAQ